MLQWLVRRIKQGEEMERRVLFRWVDWAGFPEQGHWSSDLSAVVKRTLPRSAKCIAGEGASHARAWR